MGSSARGLRSRAGALTAVAVAVGLASGFTAMAATAWTAGISRAERDDLRTSPSTSVLATRQSITRATYGAAASDVRAAVGRAGPPGTFAVESVVASAYYDVVAGGDAGGVGGGGGSGSGGAGGLKQQIPVVASATMSAHAVLVQGSWPSPATAPSSATTPTSGQSSTGSAPASKTSSKTSVPIALPESIVTSLGLRIGSVIPVHGAQAGSDLSLLVVGAYQRSATGPAFWMWDTIGPGGVEPYGGTTWIGPAIADPASFTDGALEVASASWIITPTADVLNPAALASGTRALTESLAPDSGYTVSTRLPQLLAVIEGRSAAGRAQLLAAGILVALVSGVAIGVAAGRLAACGAATAALLRSRGSPRRVLVTAFLPDVALLVFVAAVAVPVQQALNGWGNGSPSAAWLAALAVAAVAGSVVILRVARPASSAEIAAASGRQSAVPAVVRIGADVALAGLAAVALHQAYAVGLTAETGTGGTGVVLIVAAAPALAVAAGAALSARLVVAGALVGERVADRAHRLPLRLAAWELARTPLRYLVPALVCVAAVAGSGYAGAQHASWTRSVHDQAAFTTGADVAVTLGEPLDVGGVAVVSQASGVLAATPVATIGQGDSTLLAVDGKTAGQVVALRGDLIDRPAADLWSALRPAVPPGVAISGRPGTLAVTATLSGSGVGESAAGGSGADASAHVAVLVATVQDATGAAYSIEFGRLPEDGAAHTLTAQIASSGQAGRAAYPLRLLGVTLDYAAPDVADSAINTLTLSGIRGSGSGSGAGSSGDTGGIVAAVTPVASWHPQTSVEGERGVSCDPLGLRPPTMAVPPAVQDRQATADSALTITFSGGAGACPGLHAKATLSLTAGDPAAEVPAAATAAYLAANGDHVGSVVKVTVNNADIPVRIVASADTFPSLTGDSASGLVVDMTALSDAVALRGADLWPVTTWWLHTAHGAIPPNLPPDASAVSAAAVEAALLHDPLGAIPEHVLTTGAAMLVVLAVLGLLVSLLAASNDAATRDMVLGALGTTRGQRAALACLLHAGVVLPATALGVGLGSLLARILVPVFVLGPDASAPTPPADIVFAAIGSAAVGAVLVAVTLASALAASLRRGDPPALARMGS